MKVPFEIAPGIVSDETTFSTPGRWCDGSNVRFWQGKPQVVGGWTSALSDTLSGKCRNLLPWTDNSGSLNIAFGTHSHLQVYVGGELFDITPAGLVAGPEDSAPGSGYGAGPYGEGDYGEPATEFQARTWSLANYGQSLLACPRGDTVYQWENVTSSVATVITNAPDKIESMLVSPQRQAIAFGCNEETSGTYNPLCIRWSDIEDITNWTTASDNNAGEHILDGAGRIVAAKQVGANIYVWTDNALYLMQYIGQPGQTFQIDKVDENCGLIGPNAAVIINQVAFWIAPDLQFRMWSMGMPPTIIPCPIRNDFKDNLDVAQADKIVAASISQYGEAWWFYPDSRDGNENSRYVAVSVADGTWFRGTMARTALCDAGVAGNPIMVTPDGAIYFHEVGNNANGSALAWHLTSTDSYIGEAQEFMQVQGIWPDFENQVGGVSVELYVRKYPQSTSRTKGPYLLSPSASKKDFMCSGRVISMKFSGSSNPSFVRFGTPLFEVVPTGGN